MTTPSFSAQAASTAKVLQDIQQTVRRKMESGTYDDARVGRAERHNLSQMKSQDEFLSFYLRCLREASVVDISDYEIHERRRAFSPALIRFKRLIWKVMKFYTYRLWSQQNQVNGLLVTAIEGIHDKYQARIDALEARIAALEDKTSDAP